VAALPAPEFKQMKPTYFDLTVTNVAQAKAFFESTLGWRFVRFDLRYEYYRIEAGPDGGAGIDGGIGGVADAPLSEGRPLTLATITVPNLDFEQATRGLVRTLFGPAADPSIVERIARDMSAVPPDVALSAMEAAWTFGAAVPALLGELRLPVVAMIPDNPSTDPESLGRFGIEVVLLPGVGHFPMIEDPQTFNDQLLKAVKALPQREGTRRDA